MSYSIKYQVAAQLLYAGSIQINERPGHLEFVVPSGQPGRPDSVLIGPASIRREVRIVTNGGDRLTADVLVLATLEGEYVDPAEANVADPKLLPAWVRTRYYMYADGIRTGEVIDVATGEVVGREEDVNVPMAAG